MKTGFTREILEQDKTTSFLKDRIYPRNVIRSVRENLLGIEISGWMEMEEKLKSFKEDLRNLAFNYSFSWASNISLNLFAFE